MCRRNLPWSSIYGIMEKICILSGKKNKGKLEYVNFRCKDESLDKLWHERDNTREKLKKKFISKDIDPYMLMFLRDYCLRPSCYECIAKKVKNLILLLQTFGEFIELLQK